MTRSIVFVAFVGIGIVSSPHIRAQSPPACQPSNGLNFVCGVKAPEDLVQVPNTKWLITGGDSAGGGLRLIDTQAKTMTELFSTQVSHARPDTAKFAGCPGPLDPKVAVLHGLNLRAAGRGGATLYVVNHGGRESIEVFAIDTGGARPSAAWVGCVVLPEKMAGNSVAAFRDGTILTTVLMVPGKTFEQFISGQTTGVVLMWTPGSKEFRPLAGTELSGNNGLETSADNREFYVAATGSRQIFAFSRADTSKPLRMSPPQDFRPDNLRFAGNRLTAAGMILEEPSCGGRIKTSADTQCPRGWIAASIDPKTMAVTEIARGPADPAFKGTSTALAVGNELWLGAFGSERIGYRSLKP
jgi:hypothetical protein